MLLSFALPCGATTAPPRAAIVLVDNGHGRETPGKRSPDGRLQEWLWTRRVAAAIVDELQRRGIDARRLVVEETDVSLRERVRRVNSVCDSVGAERVLVVSVHVNASGSGAAWMQPAGWSAYTSPGQTAGDVLADCLYRAAALVLADSALTARLQPTDVRTPQHLHSPAYRVRIRTDFGDGDADFEAPFYLLRATRCAAVLTENLFMDNAADAAWLLTVEGRQTIVRIHVVGITMYLNRQ